MLMMMAMMVIKMIMYADVGGDNGDDSRLFKIMVMIKR